MINARYWIKSDLNLKKVFYDIRKMIFEKGYIDNLVNVEAVKSTKGFYIFKIENIIVNSENTNFELYNLMNLILNILEKKGLSIEEFYITLPIKGEEKMLAKPE